MRAIRVQDVHDASKGPKDGKVLSYTSLGSVRGKTSRVVNKYKPVLVSKYKTKHEVVKQINGINNKYTAGPNGSAV